MIVDTHVHVWEIDPPRYPIGPTAPGWIRENGPEFATYPTATFVAESLEGAPTSYTLGEEVTFKMLGQLTIR